MATRADYDERAKVFAALVARLMKQHEQKWISTEQIVGSMENPIYTWDPWAKRHIHGRYQRRQAVRNALDRAWHLGLVQCRLPAGTPLGPGHQRMWSTPGPSPEQRRQALDDLSAESARLGLEY